MAEVPARASIALEQGSPRLQRWLGAGADPKVVQRILGHASAAMTMDLYGHLIDRNLWEAAQKVGGTTGSSGAARGKEKAPNSHELGA